MLQIYNNILYFLAKEEKDIDEKIDERWEYQHHHHI